MADYSGMDTRERAIDRINQSARVLQDLKDRAELNFAMYAGEQWLPTVAQVLEDQDKAPIVFNQLLPLINNVAGDEQTNPFMPKYRPRATGERAKFADFLNGCVRYLRDQTDAQDEESQAFADNLIGGVSAVRFTQDYTESEVGRTMAERVPIFNLWWDFNAIKPNMRDGRWVAEYEYVPKEELQQDYPEYADEIEQFTASYEDLDATAGSQVRRRIAGDLWYEKDRDECLLYSYYYRKLDPYYLTVDPETQQRKTYTVEEWKNLKTNLTRQNEVLVEQGAQPMPLPTHVRLSKYRYYRCKFIGMITLEDEPTPTQSGFPIKFMTCFRYQRPDGVKWFSLIDVARDPQVWANRMLSSLAHIIATNPKGAILAEKDVFEDVTTAMEDWGKANSIVEVREGALVEGAVKVVQGEYPDDQERLYQISVNAVPQVLGLSQWSMGGQDDLRRISGQVVNTVEQNKNAMLSFPYSSLKWYRKEAGYQYLEHMKAFMSEGTMVRVSTPGTAEMVVPFKREWVEGVEYDVIVDQVAMTPTRQRELWASLNVTQGLEILMQNGAMTPDIVVEIIPDLPEELREKMRENIAKQDIVGQMMQAMEQGAPEQAMQILMQFAQEQGVQMPQPQQPQEAPVQ